MASYKKLKSGWQYRISYKLNGKFTTKSENGFRTKGEAQIAANEMELKLNKGHDIRSGERVFSEHFRDWYEIYRKGKKSKFNDDDIRKAVEFAERSFPGVRIKELTREMYQSALNKFGQTHATATVKKHHTYMRACIRDAIQDGIIYRDPTYKAVVTGKIAPKDEALKYLNFKESKKLIAAVKSNLKPRYISRYMILFGIATGCRFSEIAGLTWGCIDFENKTVRIEKTWDHKYENSFSNTKNYASKRTITIDKETLKILQNLKAQQAEKALATGLRNEMDLVFVNTKMQLVTNNAVNKTLKRICETLGITQITSHSLRHTHASMLLYKGVNIKYLSRRLGHKDIVTTLQTYSHVLDEMEQRESRQVDSMMDELWNAK